MYFIMQQNASKKTKPVFVRLTAETMKRLDAHKEKRRLPSRSYTARIIIEDALQREEKENG